MPGSVIVGSARTPIGKLSGAFADFTAMDLGGVAIKAALERAGVGAEQVDYVLMGQVLQAGQGQITARQAAVKAGIPMTVPAMTVNKVCLSGINAIYLADQMIQAGDAEVVVAGGMESMTQRAVPPPGRARRLPHGQRRARRLADQRRPVVRVRRGAHGQRHRAVRRPSTGGITRELQDELAAKSHERAAAAQKEGRFADEIAPVSIPQRKGDPIVVDTDEGVRPGTTTESLGGSAPGVLEGRHDHRRQRVADLRRRRRGHRDEPRPRPRSSGARRSPSWSATAWSPVPTRRCCTSRRARSSARSTAVDLTVTDIDLFELNEAFAAVGLASMQDLGITDDIVNVNGGAIALGHPVGMSGTRVVLTLINELRRRGGGVGAAALCGGGGQGDAAIVRTL